MYDYKEKISTFISENFSVVSSPEEANVKFTSTQLLSFIFQTFPDGCISDYELNEIMNSLGHKRFTYAVKFELELTKKQKEDPNVEKYRYDLITGWCLNSIKLQKAMTD